MIKTVLTFRIKNPMRLKEFLGRKKAQKSQIQVSLCAFCVFLWQQFS